MGRPHIVEPQFLTTLSTALDVLAADGVAAGARRLETIAFPTTEVPKRREPPISMRARVFSRDRFTCRYCGIHTVLEPIFALLGMIYPKLISYHPNWKGGAIHPILPLVIAQPDHIVPGRRSGDWLEESNLVTACAACNTLKANYLLTELGWTLLEPNTDTEWDGFTRHYRTLWEAAGRPTSSGGHQHAKWMSAFGL